MPELMPSGDLINQRADISEDEAIRLTGMMAEQGYPTGLLLESEAVADRYIEKLTTRHAVRVLERNAGPFEHSVFVLLGPMEYEGKPA